MCDRLASLDAIARHFSDWDPPLPFNRNSSPVVVRLCLPNAPIVFKALVFVVENKRESIRVQGDIIVRLFPLETYGSGHRDIRALLVQ